jgi:3-keto-disaccharide hydrolase
MWTRISRVVMVVGLSLFPILAPMLSVPAQARGEDACPEPNDSFQAACYLGPDSEPDGFISRPDDIDAYRIEVLDFNTDVHAEMQMPAAYKIELANWNGQIMASSSPGQGAEILEATVPLPGSYYLFVHSAGGAFSDSRPYTIFRSLTYPGSKIPDILFTRDFREGARSADTGDNEFCLCTETDGRYTIQMKAGGEAQNPSRAWLTNFGPDITDFTLTVDARVVNGVDSGVQVFFRKTSNDASDNDTYYVTVDTKDSQVLLSRNLHGDLTETDWTPTKAINTGGGVNRIVVRAFQDDILINVNGVDVIHISDDDQSLRHGVIGFGAIAWEDRPPIVNFDNLIITTPTEG